ncbi:hypothetical protein [Prochlorococcus marinus]|uniref:hypothetical protein n=1 Tax=Prochlorococcus marinus TaxID=1219 RepID=UPI0039B11F26
MNDIHPCIKLIKTNNLIARIDTQDFLIFLKKSGSNLSNISLNLGLAMSRMQDL